MCLSSVDSTTVTVSSQVSPNPSDSSNWFRMPLLKSSPRPRKYIISLQSSDLYTGSLSAEEVMTLLLVFKALNGIGPKYISDLLVRYEPFRPLRSSGTDLLSVPRVRTKHVEAAFHFYAPHILNKIPETCRSAETLSSFKSQLKTHVCRGLSLNQTLSVICLFSFFLNLKLYFRSNVTFVLSSTLS